MRKRGGPTKTWREIQEEKGIETRDYKVISRRAEFGRTSILIECPFCLGRVRAYLWSLSGCGKRCSCGAMFCSIGYATKEKDDGKRKRKGKAAAGGSVRGEPVHEAKGAVAAGVQGALGEVAGASAGGCVEGV